MYESHFGFHRQPFQCAELSRAFFVSESIRAILPPLLHALRSDLGIAVITGPAGVGKTSLLKHLQSLLSSDGRSIIFSGASIESPSEMLATLQTVSQQKTGEKVSVTPSDGPPLLTRRAVVEQLRKTTEFWGPVLLLIDDAQLLPVHILNELRAFTEEEWNGRGLVRILVAGPHSFEEDLARPTHADFSRRIRCHAFLQPLTTKESIEFLSRHLAAAGGRLRDVFDTGAMELITSACDGLPRCLSLLADESLVVASELSRKSADEDCIRRALTRLQHLPYPWNASPIPPEEITFAEDDKHSSPFSHSTAAYSPATTLSAGVVEFGAPGVIEFGANATVPAMTYSVVESDVVESDVVESDVVESDVVESDVVESAVVESDVAESDVAETADPVELLLPTAGEAEILELIDRSEIDVAFEVGYCFADESEPSCEPDSNSSPVFDRYTWIALGREVPPGFVTLSSTLPRQRSRDGVLPPGPRQAAGSIDPLSGSAVGSITVTRTSDQDIIASLTGHASGGDSGTFFLLQSLPLAARSAAEVWTKQETLEEYAQHALVDASNPDAVSESEWHDGQLLFSSAISEVEISPGVHTTSGDVWPLAETEQISISFEASRATREKHEEPANGILSTESNPEKFFTLPLDVNSVAWGRQSESADFDSGLPLAASLASLRDEVTSFQQTGRSILHGDSGLEPGSTQQRSSSESTLTGGTLLERAKRRLGEMAPLHAIRTGASDVHWSASSIIERPTQAPAVEELTSDASEMNNALPKFGQLFTRLRQMRNGTAENDSR